MPKYGSINTNNNNIFSCLLLLSLLLLLLCLQQTSGALLTSNNDDDLLQQQQLTSNSNENDDDEDYMPQKENVLEKSYHGLIRENETLVEITPIIKVDEEKICSLRILKKPYHEMPFEIELYNNLGILKSHHVLNCEKRKNYHFELVAVFCDGLLSAPANVHITVVDINEYAPVFLKTSYVTEVDEGYLYKDIIRLEAVDKDCTPLYGDVCKYEIINKEQQQFFTIDNDGSIRNLMPLSYKLSALHLLNIVAYDCAMKQSAPVLVTIKVRSLCQTQIKNIQQHVQYNPEASSKGQLLFPNAHLELCDTQCDAQNMNIHMSIVLQTNHLSFGCDRDIINCTHNNNNNNKNPSLQKQQQQQQMIKLLTKNAEWTKNLKYIQNNDNNNSNDDNNDNDVIYHFDGNTGILIPENILTQHDFATQSFSIVTVFRHAPLQQQQNNGDNNNNHDIKHIKEHLLCSADDHKMNRHHMALFVRNCRLILLLRKNFNEGDLNIFSPAEWRWKLPQVCDNQFHHYVVNVINSENNKNNNSENVNNSENINNNSENVGNINGGIKIELFIDGIEFTKHNNNNNNDHHNNPEVIDDWPLHAAQGVRTKLTVGACYQSSIKKLRHAFNGDISAVNVNLNGILRPETIKCLTNCAEHLSLPSSSSSSLSDGVQLNAQKNEIYVESSNAKKIDELLQQIAYVNLKHEPSYGQRNIEIRASLSCDKNSIGGNDVVVVRLPTTRTSINISNDTTTTNIRTTTTTTDGPSFIMMDDNGESEEMLTTNKDLGEKIFIIGMSNKLVSYGEIKQGVRLLADVNLTFINQPTKSEDNDDNNDENAKYLNSCNLIVFPSLNPDHEEINIDNNNNNNNNDKNLPINLNIKTNINKEGVKMLGHDKLDNYLAILHSLIYSNKKPAYYLNRVFKLTCHDVITITNNNNKKNNKNNKKMMINDKKQQQRSAEYTLTLTVLHPKQQQQQQQQQIVMTTTSPILMSSSLSNRQAVIREDANVFSHVMLNSHGAEESQAKLHAILHKTESSHSTMLIAVICIFVAILLCAIYVARMRNNSNNNMKINRHQPCPKQIIDDSLAWDDSALTITINPMQHSDAMSDASTDTDNSDSDDDEHEAFKARYGDANQLEWDNSNIFTSAIE